MLEGLDWMNKLKNKLNSQTGESIAETLVSLLIAALAILMLGGAMNAASGVVTRSRDKLDVYYSANEESNGVVKIAGGTGVEKGITITDSSGAISQQSFDVIYDCNEEFSNALVVSYKLNG